jgi:surfactin synthase thioesterase subunit
LKISNDYEKHKEEVRDLGTDINTLYSNDNNENDEILGWENYTRKECNFYKFENGHFFINHHCKEVA